MATGQQFHKSSLLGTLAYMGSPASALRNEAASRGVTGGNLFARDVKPLAVGEGTATTLNATQIAADDSARAEWLAANSNDTNGGGASAINFKDVRDNNGGEDERAIFVQQVNTQDDVRVPDNVEKPPQDENRRQVTVNENTDKDITQQRTQVDENITNQVCYLYLLFRVHL